jgi:RimJ/RimL family protein N-acetyltransferase
VRESLSLESDTDPRVRLRSAAAGDAERLRAWKNAHRASFFHQQEIGPEEQERWLEGYLARDHDFLFVVEKDGEPVGCMGVRLFGAAADVYNVILGVPEAGGQGVMSAALGRLCRFARTLAEEVSLKVLKDNAPARAFYEKNGFVVVDEADDHFQMSLDWSRASGDETKG